MKQDCDLSDSPVSGSPLLRAGLGTSATYNTCILSLEHVKVFLVNIYLFKFFAWRSLFDMFLLEF